MKRTLAVLLAILLFASSACADGLVDVAWHVDSEMFGEILAACGLNEKMAAMVSETAGKACTHLKGNAVFAEAGGHMDVSFDDTVLLDADWDQTNDACLFHTSLLPGIQIQFPETDLQSLSSAADKFADALRTYIEHVDSIEEHGRFWGYAYRSGNRKITYALNQQQLVGLLDSIWQAFGMSDYQPVQDLMSRESAMAGEAVYSVQYAEVYAGDSLNGISATLLEKNEPIAALSIDCSSGKELHVVLGAGFGDATYYTDLKFSFDESGSMAGYIDLYSDPYGIGFESARSYGLSVGNAVINQNAEQRENGSSYHTEIQYEQEGRAVFSQTIVSDAETNEITIQNAFTAPGASVPFYSSDMHISIMEPVFEMYENESDLMISLFELPQQWDKVTSAAGNGIQELILRLTVLIPALTTTDISE